MLVVPCSSVLSAMGMESRQKPRQGPGIVGTQYTPNGIGDRGEPWGRLELNGFGVSLSPLK